MGANTATNIDEIVLKQSLAEVSEVERDNEVVRLRKERFGPPKLKTEDPNKSYVQRPVKRG